jgi:hypothetical protein
MKGQRKNRLRQKEAKKNRSGICLVLAVVALDALVVWAAASAPRIGSPVKMVAAQVVHGKNSASYTAYAAQPDLADSTFGKYPDYRQLSFAHLSSFPFSVTEDMVDSQSDPTGVASNVLQQIPDFIRSFSNKKIAITGFMLPVRLDGKYVSEFLVLKDRSACCYGKTPRINEWIIAHAKGVNTKPVLDVPVTALGTFHVGAQLENGALAAIYELDCENLMKPDK